MDRKKKKKKTKSKDSETNEITIKNLELDYFECKRDNKRLKNKENRVKEKWKKTDFQQKQINLIMQIFL